MRDSSYYLLRIVPYVSDPRFLAVIDKEDVMAADHVVQLLVEWAGKNVAENLNGALMAMTNAVAIAGYLAGRYQAAARRAHKDVKRAAAEIAPDVRLRLGDKRIRVTDKAVEYEIYNSAMYHDREDREELLQDLADQFDNLRWAAVRRHETLMELSRTERVLLRSEQQ